MFLYGDLHTIQSLFDLEFSSHEKSEDIKDGTLPRVLHETTVFHHFSSNLRPRTSVYLSIPGYGGRTRYHHSCPFAIALEGYRCHFQTRSPYSSAPGFRRGILLDSNFLVSCTGNDFGMAGEGFLWRQERDGICLSGPDCCRLGHGTDWTDSFDKSSREFRSRLSLNREQP